METAKDVEEYIERAPEEVQDRLRELRATIRAAAPDAQERISYGIPFYEYKGRLVYFGHAKKHIGLYGITSPVQEDHADELKGYATSKGTIQLPLKEELPVALVRKLVEAQAKANERAEQAK
jgi:uncharacterized protein YdhG (YjbR/CyaY superfamily)